MKLNSVLIQNNKSCMVSWYLQAKLQQFCDYRALLRSAQVTKKLLGSRSNKNYCSFFRFSQFYDATKTAK